jgi:DNA polymerase family B
LNYKIELVDRFGWSARGGFTNLLNMLNIRNPYKNLCDENKSAMENYLENKMEVLKYVNYSINDVVTLSKTSWSMCRFINEILSDIGLDEFKFYPSIIPPTYGAMVAKILEVYIQNYFEKQNLKEFFKQMNKQMGISKYYQKKKTKNQKESKKDKISNLISGGSIASITHLHCNGSGILSAIIQGGRTTNERWWEYALNNTFDLDFSGCYGSALNKFDLLIGLPTVISFTTEQKGMTFKEFLEEYGKELVPNKYTITISGELDFHQSLLYSKIITAAKMQKKIKDILDEEDSQIVEEFSGDFVILERELVNTIITSDILDALTKICSLQELKSIYNCNVVSAIFYKKSDYHSDPKEFLKSLTHTSDFYYYNVTNQSYSDERSRTWTSIPLNGFIQPLITLRKEKKKLMKDATNDDEKRKYDGLQYLIKTIVNTTYGVLASPYFQVGNIVVANNITARARLAVWMSSRTFLGTLLRMDTNTSQTAF